MERERDLSRIMEISLEVKRLNGLIVACPRLLDSSVLRDADAVRNWELEVEEERGMEGPRSSWKGDEDAVEVGVFRVDLFTGVRGLERICERSNGGLEVLGASTFLEVMLIEPERAVWPRESLVDFFSVVRPLRD